MSKKSYYTKERGTEFSKSQLEEMFDEIRSVIDEFEQKFKLKAIKDINAMKRLTELDCYIAGIKIESIIIMCLLRIKKSNKIGITIQNFDIKDMFFFIKSHLVSC